MLFKQCSVCVIGVILCCSYLFSQGPTARIIGGTASSASDYDFFVSLMFVFNWDDASVTYEPTSDVGYSWNTFCGGSYIGDQKIITAAHCVEDLGLKGHLYLLVGNRSEQMQYEYCRRESGVIDCVGRPTSSESVSGGYDYTGYILYTGDEANLIKIPFTSITIHAGYNSNSFQNDIAIIQLPNALTNTAIHLPSYDEFSALAETNANVRSIGHGDTVASPSISSQSADLMQVDLSAQTNARCSAILPGFDAETMVCAGDLGVSKDSCQGDSGGALLNPDTGSLLGIVSWGYGCANYYGAYTDVFEYLSWIESGWKQDAFVYVDKDSDEIYRLGNVGIFSWPFALLILLGLLPLRNKAPKHLEVPLNFSSKEESC